MLKLREVWLKEENEQLRLKSVEKLYSKTNLGFLDTYPSVLPI